MNSALKLYPKITLCKWLDNNFNAMQVLEIS
jgi:hypothetical protein